jgi:hypothetical protein
MSQKDLGGAGSLDGIIAESFSPEMPRSRVSHGASRQKEERAEEPGRTGTLE